MVTKKFIILIGLLLVTFGCSPQKNSQGMPRSGKGKFTIAPNSNDNYLSHVDIYAFYKMIERDGETRIGGYEIEKLNNGLVFYHEGRIGFFKGINPNNVRTLDPKMAHMGLYNFNAEKFAVQRLYEVPHGKFVLSDGKLLLGRSTKDTIYIQTFPSATAKGAVTTYVRVPTLSALPKELPDW